MKFVYLRQDEGKEIYSDLVRGRSGVMACISGPQIQTCHFPVTGENIDRISLIMRSRLYEAR